MKEWQRVVGNATIVAGITFLSSLGAFQELRLETIYTAGIAFGLTFLTLCKPIFKKNRQNPKEPVLSNPTEPENDTNGSSIFSFWF